MKHGSDHRINQTKIPVTKKYPVKVERDRKRMRILKRNIKTVRKDEGFTRVRQHIR